MHFAGAHQSALRKKISVRIVTKEYQLEAWSESCERRDFWNWTNRKQLNFLQHVKTPLRTRGTCVIVVPNKVSVEDVRDVLETFRSIARDPDPVEAPC